MNHKLISADIDLPTPFLRGMNVSKFNRKFARKKWRESFGSGMFMYRGKIPSCPSFAEFCMS